VYRGGGRDYVISKVREFAQSLFGSRGYAAAKKNERRSLENSGIKKQLRGTLNKKVAPSYIAILLEASGPGGGKQIREPAGNTEAQGWKKTAKAALAPWGGPSPGGKAFAGKFTTVLC